MVSVGIIGLPNSGKSTLFNALVGSAQARTAEHPFTTIDKNVGVVNVPDDTLFTLAAREGIEKVTPATVTFIDIAGLIRGAHKGEGLGNEFLGHIREVDLMLHVVRFFKSERVSHVHAKIDPKEDLDVVREELMLADIAVLERKLTKEKNPPAGGQGKDQKLFEAEKKLAKKLIGELNTGKLAREVSLTGEEEELITSFNLLTAKKEIIVANVGEDDLGNPSVLINGEQIIRFCAKLEADLAELTWVEQRQFLKEYGLKESAKESLISACYNALDLITFYTIAKRKEARAWSVPRGTTAIDAAGKIHTDFAKHFIKAEVIPVKELLTLGTWFDAYRKGKVTTHGKDYLVQEGDVVEFKIGK